MTLGARNLITDIPGLRVGNAEEHRIRTGVTALTADVPFTAAAHVMGGAPGTRETDLLAPDSTVQQVDAIVLSGGSAFGLDAASGVADALRAAGRGYAVAGHRVPLVPAAILFDLQNGGDKAWAENPYPRLGRTALDRAAPEFALGSVGAGAGATTAGLKGGLGSASLVTEAGHTVGALAAVNTVGAVTVGDGPHFWAAAWEVADEFGGLGPARDYPDPCVTPRLRNHLLGVNTTLAVVATDAALTKAQLKRMATAAHDGMARAIVPSHTLYDGDIVFALSTGARPLAEPVADLYPLGHAAAVCLCRAIARAVYSATPAEGDVFPCWRQRFGGG